MLAEIIQALEKRKETIEVQRAEDRKRREVVAPLLSDIANLLVKILSKSSAAAGSPEEAYTSLRNSIIELHTELSSNVEEMTKSDFVWDGRAEELRQIVDDLTTLHKMSQAAPKEEEDEVDEEESPQVRARPRKIGEKPSTLRSQRSVSE